MTRVIAALAVILFSTASMALADCRDDRVDLRGPWGQTGFSVEIADDDEERSRGLMFRKDMPRGAGMLFVYETPRRASFWMKNTLIPLDMIFVDRQGRIQHVHHDAVPGDLSPITGGDNIYAVLEINAGLARRYGITVGSDMRHPVFADGPAAWAC